MLKIDSYASVWDAISDTPEEAANLRLRSELMDKITALIQTKGWTQADWREVLFIIWNSGTQEAKNHGSRDSTRSWMALASALFSMRSCPASVSQSSCRSFIAD